MTTTITTSGRLTAADADNRILRYLLLPYGEPGATSLGRLTASRGSVSIPEDAVGLRSVRLDIEHDRTRPVGHAVELSESESGLTAAFQIARTRAGDDLLEEAREGLRTGISVDTEDTVIRNGRLLAARLVGAGAVVRSAFPSAQMVASDHGELLEEHETHREDTYTDPDGATTTVTEDTTTTVVHDPEPDETDPDDPDNPEEEADMADSTTKTMTASAPAGGPAAASRGSRMTAAKTSLTDAVRLLATAFQAGGKSRLTAALADIVPGDILGLEQPQYIGELWNGKAYERRIIPLFNHADLTSFKVAGWRWITKPTVAPYSGNKTAVPSNQVETAPVTLDAERIAGAHDIDRKFRDFGDEEFFRSYFAAMTESYAIVSDGAVLTEILAAATPVVRGAVPANVSPGMTSIVDGALSVLTKTRSTPSFAVVAPNVWREIILTRQDDTLAYLNASLGLEDGTLGSFRIVPDPGLDAGDVLVGVKDAATVHELGGSPIRVEALDIARGGIDEGVFGYYAVNIHDADGLALVSPA